jgi:general secretion pathway protein A
MYLEHFGLTVSPFGISPRLDFLYRSGAFEESMAHLVYGLDHREAIVMITGAIGTGKTMATQSFLAYLGDRYVSALITNTSVDGKELLKLILDDLGQPVDPTSDKSDLLIAFKNYMVAAGKQGQRIVIVIDEAQNLHREVLEEIRLLTNLGQGEEQPVQIILVGQPELEATVQRPDLAQLKQRIRVHYKLTTLSRRELEEYVNHRIAVAGGPAGVFSGGALDRIHAVSGGVPRVVNTLCGEALLSAYVAGRRKVEARDLDDQAEGTPAATPEERESARPERPLMALRPAMAERREVVAEPEAADHSGRGRGWLLAALVVVAVIVALAATGQFKPLWPRLPFSGRRDAAAEHTATIRAATPLENVTATQAVDSTSVTPPLVVAASDSAAAIADSVGVELVPESVAVIPATAIPAPEDGAQVATPPRPAGEAVGAFSDADVSEPTVVDGEYFVHVSSFRTIEHAGAVARQFADDGVLAAVRQQMVNDTKWYRVYLGPFATRDEATGLAERLRAAGAITYAKIVRLGAGEGL